VTFDKKFNEVREMVSFPEPTLTFIDGAPPPGAAIESPGVLQPQPPKTNAKPKAKPKARKKKK